MKKAAADLRKKLPVRLRPFATFAVRRLMGQKQVKVAQSNDGKLNGLQYHRGTSSDRIPITFYKRPEHYKAIEAKDGDPPTIPVGAADPYHGVGLGTSAAVKFPMVGWKLDDMGGVRKRQANVRVRGELSAAGYDLEGLEIDHVHDMGFGGRDELDNSWPLARDVNQRPNSGAWRSQYRFRYWNFNEKTIKEASINSGGMRQKHYVIKDFAGMEGGGRDDLPAEHGKPHAGTTATSSSETPIEQSGEGSAMEDAAPASGEMSAESSGAASEEASMDDD